MGKILLVGPAGCGKTHHLLEAFEGALRKAPDPLASDLFFIVPSAEHTERIVSLLIQGGMPGFFHKRVTTLSRLVNDIFRISDIPIASSLTRMMITKNLLYENNWEYFSEVRDQPGFLNLMPQFIAELKEACISPDVFRERMNMLKSFEPAYASKYEALAGFYEQYEKELRTRGLRDHQDALRIFRERETKGERQVLRFKGLWIDGFFDFSGLQLEYLRELSVLSEEMVLTLTKEDGEAHEDAFESVNETQKNLERLGFQVQKMEGRSFRTQKKALLYLQRNLFASPPPDLVSGPCQDIVFLEAIGTEGEIEMIVREIHQLYASGNYRYSDFAVLFRHIKNYASVLASVFARYGIPVEIHERKRLKFSSWIATAVSLLAIFRNGWQAEDLFAFLKSGYVCRFGGNHIKNEEWIVLFEQRAFQAGVVETRDAWLVVWDNAEDDINTRKKDVLDPLAKLEDEFRAVESIHEFIRIFKSAVYETFGILQISDNAASFVREDAACVNRFELLLEEMRNHFLKNKIKKVSFENFADYFFGLVELDVYSLHERDKNRVQVYDVSLARQKEYKVVFVAGLLEKVFPVQVREDPLLSDWERKLMNSGMAFSLAERLPRQHIERYFFYLAVTRASEKLYLSCPHLDFEGKESLPSSYLEGVKGLFGDRIQILRQDLARPFPLLKEAITARELEIAAMGALREVSEKKETASGLLKQVLFGLLENPQSRQRLFSACRSVEAKLLDEKILKGKFFEVREASPTRIEEYAKCPYRYFANHMLKLRETAEDINMMQKGNILHYVLQQYFDPKRKKKVEEKMETFIERGLETGFQKYPLIWPQKYHEALDRRELYEMLLFFLQKETERLKSSSFKPCRVEYSFGSKEDSESSALEIAGEGKPLTLQGRIDRIDTNPSEEFAVVMDYKRSAKFKSADLELGIALQLPLYLLAAKEKLGLEPLGGEIYSVRDRKRSGFYCQKNAQCFESEFSSRSQLSEEVFQKVLDRAVVFAFKFVKEIEKCEISVKPRNCESFCPYDTVCRIEKWKLPLILQEIRNKDKKDGLISGEV
ncbi:MAG TPA: exodeoxyribonuclease V subunit gamma [Candidatus Omnitrophota bacterium]|nr:exodeoxyribonuclease V subunit gamma [Candidatus Omnitrophota bacterium]